MRELFAVALGGALGAVLRYLAGAVAVERFGWRPFAATAGINLLGCFAIGLLLGALARGQSGVDGPGPASEGWRLLLGVGLLGSFTTFSAFSHETLALLREGAFGLALGNVALQLVLGLAAVAAGRALAGF